MLGQNCCEKHGSQLDIILYRQTNLRTVDTINRRRTRDGGMGGFRIPKGERFEKGFGRLFLCGGLTREPTRPSRMGLSVYQSSTLALQEQS